MAFDAGLPDLDGCHLYLPSSACFALLCLLTGWLADWLVGLDGSWVAVSARRERAAI